LSSFKVVVVTKGVSDKDLKEMFFIPISDIQQAIEESIKIMGQDAEFIFIPHGSDIIPELES
jgi:nickel-dependent lactate racemase